MIDIKTRNRRIENILAPLFGRKNIRVSNGERENWGWCEVEIKTGARTDDWDKDMMMKNDIMKFTDQLLSEAELNRDDYGDEITIRVKFEHNSASDLFCRLFSQTIKIK